MNAAAFLRKAEAGQAVLDDAPMARVADAWPGGRRMSASMLATGISHVVPASRLEVRPAPALAPTGVAAIDALTGGLPRGALTEIFGPASSGRTSLLVSTLAAITARGEVCALVDTCDSFAPQVAQAAGVELDRLLWVRCGNQPQRPGAPNDVFAFLVSGGRGERATRNPKSETWARLEQALKATDLLLQSGGFGLVVVDLADLSSQAARRVPLTSWFRFRRAVENTATVLLVLGRESCAKTCASLVLQLSQCSGRSPEPVARNRPAHAELLTGIAVRAELIRSRFERKSPRSATAQFETQAQWA